MLYCTVRLLKGKAMNTYMSALVASNTEEFMYPTKFCDKFRFAYSTLSARIRSGEIALHQFPDERRPKINVSEALQVMSVIKRPYNSPDLRVVRHDDDAGAARPVKSDLFA
jgi:hypothetical protein